MTATEAALLAGIPARNVRRFINGETALGHRDLERLLALLKLRLVDLEK